MIDAKTLNKMNITDIKQLQEYKNIPEKYNKSKLTKKELVKLIVKLNQKKKDDTLKVDKKIIEKEQKKLIEISKDIKRISNKKEQDTLLEKYGLISQRDYLLDLVKLKMYNDSVKK